MVLKRNQDWQKRSRRRCDNIPNAENGHDKETQETENNEEKVPKGRVTILEMTVQQFTSLFMKGYRIAKEEGFSDKDAEDFGVFTATRFAAIWMEDRLAQKKEAEKKAKRKTEEEDDHGEENDDE